jgi:hypothetical protein
LAAPRQPDRELLEKMKELAREHLKRNAGIRAAMLAEARLMLAA